MAAEWTHAMALEWFSFHENHSTSASLTAADLKVRACAGAPDDRRAAFAAWSDSDQTGIAPVSGHEIKMRCRIGGMSN